MLEYGASLVAQMVKCLPTMRETRVRSLGREDTLEKETATHSSIHAWKTPWTEEPGGLQSMGSQRVRHDWATSLHFTLFLNMHRIYTLHTNIQQSVKIVISRGEKYIQSQSLENLRNKYLYECGATEICYRLRKNKHRECEVSLSPNL